MKTHGFTLLELMVVITIASVVLLLSAPTFIDVVRANRLTTTTNELVGTLHIARSEAIKRNSDIALVMGGENAVEVLPTGCNTESCKVRVIQTLPDNYRLTFYAATDTGYSPANTLLYHGDGSLTPTGYLKLCAPDRLKVILLTMVGHLQIAKDRDNNGLPEIFNPQSGAFEDVAACQ